MAKKTNPEIEGIACCARTFHLLLIPVFLAVLVPAAVSLGVFLTRHNQISGDACTECGSCILFATVTEDDMFMLSEGVTCALVIWGEGVIAAIGVGLILLAVVKIGFKTKPLNWLVVFELFFAVGALILGFVIGILISTGLKQTCGAFNDDGQTMNVTICEQQVYPPESENQFYSDINTVQVFAWIGVGGLSLTTIIYLMVAAIYCIKGKSYKDDTIDLLPYPLPKKSTTKKEPKASKFSKTSGAQDKSKGD